MSTKQRIRRSRRTVMAVAIIGVMSALTAAGPGERWLGGVARAAGGVVNFVATDDVGPWFKCVGAGCVAAGTQSLAVVRRAPTSRSRLATSPRPCTRSRAWCYPSGAAQMPFDQPAAFRDGSRSVKLDNPGLYVFVCKVHPFMLAATIVDDPVTPGSISARTSRW